MKVRHVYTVIREFNVRDKSFDEEKQSFQHIKDETGEFLYGSGMEEKIGVQLQVLKDGEWVTVDELKPRK